MVSRWPAGGGGGGGGGPADLGTATGILSIDKGGTGSATGFTDLEDDVLALQSGKENAFSILPVNKGGTGSATGFTDLQTTVSGKENAFSVLPIAKGGTGSATGFTDLETTVNGKENSFAVLPVNKGGTGSATGFTDLQTSVNAKLDRSGGTMTGALTLSGAPSASLEAATKAYVDSLSGITINSYNSAGAPFIQAITANTHNLFNTSQSVGNFYWANLPSPTNGTFVVIKDSTGNASNCQIVILTGATIDGQTSYTLRSPFESVRLIANGSAWFII